MPFPILGAIGLGSALLGAFGRSRQAAAQRKQQAAQSDRDFRQAQADRAARGAKHSASEKARIATLRSVLAMAGNRGIKGIDINSLDPSLFEERPFTDAEVIAPPKETGHSTLGDILAGVGDIGGATVDVLTQQQERKKREAETQKLMCVLNPRMPGCETAGAPPVRGDVTAGGGGNA